MKIVSSVEKFKNRLFTVTEDHAVEPGGFQIRRAIVHHRGSAVMMPVDNRKRVLLVRQYRLPAERFLWELPAGSV
ncbi:MAG: NUDIX hydrolase, partial [Bryobacteraceae bacterium]